MVIWITGLSGAGKTTLAKEIIKQLANEKKKPILLDGDQLREIFVDFRPNDTHDRSSRLALALKYSNLARLLSAKVLGNSYTISLLRRFIYGIERI